MSEPAAFRATYSDWKLIRTRKCVQLVFEVPIEESNKAYEVLGGMPNPASEIWCAVARLVEPAEESAHKPPPSATSEAGAAPKSKLAQRIGILCSDPVFQKFLCWKFVVTSCDEERAAKHVRAWCGVTSRSEIIWNTAPGNKWEDLHSDFMIWRQRPELDDVEAVK